MASNKLLAGDQLERVNEMTTIKLSGGDLGQETMLVRCNLTEASAPVMAQYNPGDDWSPTQYQCADASHRTSGLIEVAKVLAARAVEMRESDFDCDADVI